MKKRELQTLVVECLQEYFAERTFAPVKENTMKRSELMTLVNEVVRQVVKETGPQYKVQTGKTQIDQPGKVNRARQIQGDPVVNEMSPPGGDEEGSMPDNGPEGLGAEMSGDAEMDTGVEGEGHAYDEQEEIAILKQLALLLIRLLKMHQGVDEPAGGEEDEMGGEEPTPPFPPKADKPSGPPKPSPKSTPPPSEPDEPADEPEEEDNDEDLDENHKVQARSHTTIRDVPQNPKNVRKPSVPMP